jgi:hypothetical protein
LVTIPPKPDSTRVRETAPGFSHSWSQPIIHLGTDPALVSSRAHSYYTIPLGRTTISNLEVTAPTEILNGCFNRGMQASNTVVWSLK